MTEWRFQRAAELRPEGVDAVPFIERFRQATADSSIIQQVSILRAALEPIGLRAARDTLQWDPAQGSHALEELIGAYLPPAGIWSECPRPWTAGVPVKCPLPAHWSTGWSSAESTDRQVLADWLEARGDARGMALNRCMWAQGIGADETGLWALATVGRGQMRMRWIPGGRYQRGRPGAVSAMRPHTVTLSTGFWMSETVLVEATLRSRLKGWRLGRAPLRVSKRQDAEQYVSDLQSDLPARLPTEAEWECACRAGTVTDTYLGDRKPRQYDDVFSRAGGNVDVQKGPPNPLGLYDMNTGSAELCADGFAAYTGDASDPLGRGTEAVVRGGDHGPAAWRRGRHLSGWFAIRLVVSA